jgi:hypothetical protein
MISIKEILLSKELGKKRGSLIRSRGRRETSHHFSEIFLKDNQF